MPEISVIVPCFNQAEYLKDSIGSILAQTFEDWECIIVNDGSTDNTEEIALAYCSVDNRFLYIKKENGGPSSSKNIGIRQSKGNFIQFLDADDVIDKNKFEIQIAQLKNTSPYALSYCDYFASIDSDLSIPYPKRYMNPRFKSENYLLELIRNWEFSMSIPCHCYLFKSEIFKEKNIFFDEKLMNHEDWDCWMSIFSHNPEVYFIDQILATYRIQENSVCFNIDLMYNGFLKALSKQKEMQKKNSMALHLLSIKYFQVKYGGKYIYKVLVKGLSIYTKILLLLKQI
jgi:glycosyltransferase involved in cell wall biosynthesis